MPFLSPLILEDHPGHWRLHAPLRYRSARFDAEWTVPAGFATDLASVPRLFWRLFPRDGDYRKAAVVHDYLVREPVPALDGEPITWGEAAQVFDEAMADLGIAGWRRWPIVLAVRLAGLVR